MMYTSMYRSSTCVYAIGFAWPGKTRALVRVQVRRHGPMFAHGMLTVEQYNVYLKKWSRSRKNVGEGMSRQNAYIQEVTPLF